MSDEWGLRRYFQPSPDEHEREQQRVFARGLTQSGKPKQIRIGLPDHIASMARRQARRPVGFRRVVTDNMLREVMAAARRIGDCDQASIEVPPQGVEDHDER